MKNDIIKSNEIEVLLSSEMVGLIGGRTEGDHVECKCQTNAAAKGTTTTTNTTVIIQ